MSRWDDYDGGRERGDSRGAGRSGSRRDEGEQRGDRSERDVDRDREHTRGPRRDDERRPARAGEETRDREHRGSERGYESRTAAAASEGRDEQQRSFEGGSRGRGGGPDRRGGRRGKRRGPEEEESESMYEWGKKDNPEDKDSAEGQEKAEGGGGDGDGGDGDGEKPKVKKVKPNMERSGKLQEEALKTESGVVLKFAEPPEAKRPSRKWRLYPFKGDQALDVIPVHHKASYLFGRDRAVAAIPTDHISCSKQHAVLVHREINIKDELGIGFGKMVVKPYIIDLVSANGTFLNGKRIDASRYYELKPKDVLKFGQSSREYVLLHDELAKS